MKKPMREDKYRTSFSLIAVIVTVGIVLSILSLVVYLNVDFFKSILGLDGNSGIVDKQNILHIPEFDNNENGVKDNIFYDNNNNVLDSVQESDSYVRELRVIRIYDDNQSISQYTITKKHEQYRVDSAECVYIFDGSTLYVESDTYKSKHSSVLSEMYSIIGITPLSSVLEQLEKLSGVVSVSPDKKHIIVQVDNQEKSISSRYEIAIESGIVTAESHYYEDALYLIVLTDAIDIFAVDNLPSDYFTIPE